MQLTVQSESLATETRRKETGHFKEGKNETV